MSNFVSTSLYHCLHLDVRNCEVVTKTAIAVFGLAYFFFIVYKRLMVCEKLSCINPTTTNTIQYKYQNIVCYLNTQAHLAKPLLLISKISIKFPNLIRKGKNYKKFDTIYVIYCYRIHADSR